jgi:hypothetical protein
MGLFRARIDPNGDEQRPSEQQRRSRVGGVGEWPGAKSVVWWVLTVLKPEKWHPGSLGFYRGQPGSSMFHKNAACRARQHRARGQGPSKTVLYVSKTMSKANTPPPRVVLDMGGVLCLSQWTSNRYLRPRHMTYQKNARWEGRGSIRPYWELASWELIGAES